MAQIAKLDARLNDLIRQGKALEAFEEFYADDVVMMENDQPFAGKDVNRKREQEFFRSIAEVRKMEIGPSAVGDGVTFCKQAFDCTFKDGRRMNVEEVAVREWRNGKIVKERFYYMPG